MDATFRAELRELNEHNFQRFDAKLEQRIAEVNARIDQGIAELRGELRSEISLVRTEVSDLKAELIKWMFLFWLGTVATMLSFGRLLLTS